MRISSMSIVNKKLMKKSIDNLDELNIVNNIFDAVIRYVAHGQREVSYNDISDITGIPLKKVKNYISKLVNCGAINLDEKQNEKPQKEPKFVYEESKGVCGILRPTGRFIHCRYGCHNEFMDKIPKDIQEKCLWFSSKTTGEGQNSAVGCEKWENGITQKQYNWIISHKNHFDKGQLSCLYIVFKGRIKII